MIIRSLGRVFSSSVSAGLFALVLLSSAALQDETVQPVESVDRIHGMTISTHGGGRDWGTEAFDVELDRLQALGINWVAIHPYAGLRDDGSLGFRDLQGEIPPEHVVRPIRAAHERGMKILIKPHLAYWGSPFSWRGEVAFEDPEKKERFWKSLTEWTVKLAAASRGADAFCVGTELEKMVGDEGRWRALIAGVRAVSDSHLTYAANWDGVERVGFWDALDAIGVQAYFPLLVNHDEGKLPTAKELRAAWKPHLDKLQALSKKTGKPVVFAELGYDCVETTNVEPWKGAPRRVEPTDAGREMQLRCLKVAFEMMEDESEWLRGAFLWKWFTGGRVRGDFRLDHEAGRALLTAEWGGESAGE